MSQRPSQRQFLENAQLMLRYRRNQPYHALARAAIPCSQVYEYFVRPAWSYEPGEKIFSVPTIPGAGCHQRSRLLCHGATLPCLEGDGGDL